MLKNKNKTYKFLLSRLFDVFLIFEGVLVVFLLVANFRQSRLKVRVWAVSASATAAGRVVRVVLLLISKEVVREDRPNYRPELVIDQTALGNGELSEII